MAPLGDPHRIARQFRTSGATVLLLLRRDILNMQISLYYTFTVLPALGEIHHGHVQFAVIDMTPDERADYLERLRGRRFHVDPDCFAAQIEEFVDGKSAFLEWRAVFVAAGVPTATIVYEDFLRDKQGFLMAFAQRIGLDWHPEMADSHSPKVNREDMRGQVENIAEIEAAPRIVALLARWDEFCRAMGA